MIFFRVLGFTMMCACVIFFSVYNPLFYRMSCFDFQVLHLFRKNFQSCLWHCGDLFFFLIFVKVIWIVWKNGKMHNRWFHYFRIFLFIVTRLKIIVGTWNFHGVLIFVISNGARIFKFSGHFFRTICWHFRVFLRFN